MSEIINQLEQQQAKCSEQSQKPLISLSNPLITEKKMSVYKGDLHLETRIAQYHFIKASFG